MAIFFFNAIQCITSVYTLTSKPLNLRGFQAARLTLLVTRLWEALKPLEYERMSIFGSVKGGVLGIRCRPGDYLDELESNSS